jgi:hypothetical protein
VSILRLQGVRHIAQSLGTVLHIGSEIEPLAVYAKMESVQESVALAGNMTRLQFGGMALLCLR